MSRFWTRFSLYSPSVLQHNEWFARIPGLEAHPAAQVAADADAEAVVGQAEGAETGAGRESGGQGQQGEAPLATVLGGDTEGEC